jgi:hypothetical protein
MRTARGRRHDHFGKELGGDLCRFLALNDQNRRIPAQCDLIKLEQDAWFREGLPAPLRPTAFIPARMRYDLLTLLGGIKAAHVTEQPSQLIPVGPGHGRQTIVRVTERHAGASTAGIVGIMDAAVG